MSGSETMTVLVAFTEYPGGVKTHRAKGDELTGLSKARADHLRDAGLARSKPKPQPEPKAEASRTDPDTPSRG